LRDHAVPGFGGYVECPAGASKAHTSTRDVSERWELLDLQVKGA
jgi:hypothetical protein